jgi:putative membrane protein
VPVLTLSPARIVVAAVTGLLPVVVTPLLVATWFAVLAIPARSGGAALRGGSLVAITVVAVFVVGFTALGRVINDWGWRLERVGDQLHLRAGLTTVRHLTMPLRRVQHVTVSDNPLRRALGLCSIAVSSAAGPGASQQATTRLVVPVLRTSDVAAVLAAGLGDGWDIPPLTPRPPAARARAVRRRILALAIPAATGAAIAVLSGASALAVLAALVVLVGIPWGLIAHRRAGWAETEHACVLAKGVVHHRIAIVPVAKVQSARCADNPFQRRSRLRSLHLDVAGDESPLTSGTWDDTVLDDLPDDVAIRLCRTLPRRSGGAIQVGPPT